MNTSVRRPCRLKKRSGVARVWEGLQRLEERVLCTIALTLDQVPTFYTKSNGVLTGTVSDVGSPVRLAIAQSDGTFIAIPGADVDGNGHWSLHLNGVNGIPNGRFDIAVTANHNGDTGQTNVFDAFVIDDVAPVLGVNPTGLPLATKNPVTITGTYNDANISGVAVKLNDGVGGITTVNAVLNTANKTWSAVVSGAAVGDGTYAVSVVAADLSGNQTTVNVVGALTLDTAFSLTAGSVVSDQNNVIVSGTVDSDATSLQVTVNGVIYAIGSGVVVAGNDWTLALPPLSEGNYPMTVTAGDAAGNSVTLQRRVLVDQTSPTAAFGSGMPGALHGNTTFSGTFVDAAIDTVQVTVDDGAGHSRTFDAVINATAGTWTMPVNVAGLPDGNYGVTLTAEDLAGHTFSQGAGSLNLDTAAPVVSTTTVMTGDATPPLSGTVDDLAAVVTVTLHGTVFPAVNHGDGTWTIADNVIPTLANGVYRPVVTATDPAGNVGTFNGAVLVVNGVSPKVTVDTVLSTATSPALSGTVSDPGADVLVTVNGNSYAAVNNGDGTWTVGAGIVAALPTGTYNVAAAATNAFGGQGADVTTNELTVATAQTVTLGGAITSLSYVDADGTTVTVTAGKGAVALTLVGLDVAVTGTGKTRKVTATGGVRQLDIEVQAATTSLAFKTNNGGDALTAIRKITGSGVLATLTGAAVDLTGSIAMTGSIGSMTLRSICGDVTMASAPAGVSIVANFFSNSTITVPTIKALTAKTRFANTRVVATTVLTATLNNVQTNNHGAAFGITATSLKALTVVQAGTSLKWKKQFTTGILDFAVVAPLV